jgi:hypothetical protein
VVVGIGLDGRVLAMKQLDELLVRPPGKEGRVGLTSVDTAARLKKLFAW